MDIGQWVEIFLDPEAIGARRERRLETGVLPMED
jgi:hypothetical protein